MGLVKRMNQFQKILAANHLFKKIFSTIFYADISYINRYMRYKFNRKDGYSQIGYTALENSLTDFDFDQSCHISGELLLINYAKFHFDMQIS